MTLRRFVSLCLLVIAMAVTGCGDGNNNAGSSSGSSSSSSSSSGGGSGSGSGSSGGATFTDADSDGYPADVDCDDNDGDINPGATEVYYDGDDNDCDDGTVDDDQDGDGSVNDDDCDDTDATIYPGATELDDGKDNDCDGDAEETGTFDADGDGYSPLFGSAADPTPDCDDNDASVNPGVDEIYYNGKNDDCDAATVDNDQDGDGDPVASDCDDTNANRSSLMSEIYYDGLDNDCDGMTVDGDQDGDGFESMTVGGDDCGDTDADRNPGKAEVPGDGVDNDCSGSDLTASDASGYFVAEYGDDNSAGTMAEPFATVQKGADAASETPAKARVFVAEGVYVESVDAGVPLIGGYNDDFSAYDAMSFKAKITSDASGQAGIEVSADTSVDLIGLDIAGFTAAANGNLYGVRATNAVALRIYASTITSGNKLAGGSSDNAYTVHVDEGGVLTIEDSTIQAGDFGSVNLNQHYGIYARYLVKTVIDNVSVTAYGSSYAGDDCRAIYLYQTQGTIVDSDSRCDSSVEAFNHGWYLDLESGVYHVRDNQLGTPDDDFDSYARFFYYGASSLWSSGNTYDMGDTDGDTVLWADYGDYYFDNETVNTGTWSGNGTLFYAANGSIDIRNSNFNLGDLNGTGDNFVFYLEQGSLTTANNTVNSNYVDGSGGELHAAYVEYAHWDSSNDEFNFEQVDGDVFGIGLYNGGTLYASGMAFDVTGTVGGDFVYLFNENVSAHLSDSNVFVQEVDGATYMIDTEYGYAEITDNYFEVVTANAYATGAYVYYGAAWFEGNTYVVGEAGTYEGINCTYAECSFVDETFETGPALSGDSTGIYAFDASLTLASSNFEMVGSTGGDAYWFYSDCCDLQQLYDNYANVGTASGAIWGVFDNCCADLIMEGNVVRVGDSGGDSYGFDHECCSTLELVNNVFEVTGTTGGESFALYFDCCDGSYIVNNYFAASSITATTSYGLYAASNWGHYAFVNNVINAGRADSVHGIYLQIAIALTLRNNIITTPNGADGFTELFYSDDFVGVLDTFAELNDCDDDTSASRSAECLNVDGNFFADLDSIFVNRAAGNFTHKGTSPGVDAGVNPQPSYQGDLANVDMEGTPRPQGSAYDIGPDELGQ